MIVPSMTVQEIHKEVFEDTLHLRNKLEDFKKNFKKLVLKSSRYPLTKSYDHTTKEKKNSFIVTFTALKRSAWKKPILNIYGIYTRPEGKYAVVISLDIKISSIHPPHFFKRYRERILKDELISNEEVIRQFFENDWGFMATVINEEYKSVYYSFENCNKDDKVSFVAATSQGFCFGEKQGDVNIIKTIISENMLFENQIPVFNELKIAFYEANKERYNGSIK